MYDKVEANYRGRGKYYTGKIREDRGDGTFDIDYDDGEKETRVREELIRSLERPSSPSRPTAKLSEGDKVEANYRGRGKYYPGKIKYDNRDGTYDIDYDDGEKERSVKEADIKSLESGGSASANMLRRGDKVEANYRGRGKYYTCLLYTSPSPRD